MGTTFSDALAGAARAVGVTYHEKRPHPEPALMARMMPASDIYLRAFITCQAVCKVLSVYSVIWSLTQSEEEMPCSYPHFSNEEMEENRWLGTLSEAT